MKYVILFVLLLATPAHALERVEYSTGRSSISGTIDLGPVDSPSQSLKDLAKNYIDVPKGATDWKLLGSTAEKNIQGKDKDGYEYQYYKPVFTPEVKALAGKEITVKGFMFPLDSSDKQKEFLLGPFPVGCPFHYHVAPALVIEVHAEKKPAKFSYDPITVKGVLELVPADPDSGVFYRLKNAEVVK